MSAHDVEHANASPIELVLRPKSKDLGGFPVRRALPAVARRRIGPFVFFDHFGPTDIPPGQESVNVRPHPHIALATITYLFSGEIFHRDSLGTAMAIRPGDVNWMVAGRGITHSERTSPELLEKGQHLHGLQAWVALPLDQEECEPAFYHHDAAELPERDEGGVRLRIVAGEVFGMKSPLCTASPTLYVDVHFTGAGELDIAPEYAERAVYVASGEIEIAGQAHGDGDLVVLREGANVTLRASAAARVMLLGGAPLDGERHMYWNFVASTKERIEKAKADWREGRFAKVPGDEVELIPLPEDA